MKQPVLSERSLAVAIACVLLFLWPGCKSERSIDELESSLPRELLAQWETPAGDTLARIQRLFVPHGRAIAGDDDREVGRGEVFDRPFNLTSGECTAAIAVSEDGEDIDLFLLEPDGQIVARDEGTDSFPVIARYCATKTGIYTVRIRARRATRVQWRRYHLPTEDGDGALEALRIEHAPQARVAIAPQTNALRESERLDTPFVAEAGRCYQILAAGLDRIGDLDVYVRNDEHGLDVQEIAVGPSLVTRGICVDETQTLHLAFRAHRGSGRFRWQIVETTPQPSRPSPATARAPESADASAGADADAGSAGEANPSPTGPLRAP